MNATLVAGLVALILLVGGLVTMALCKHAEYPLLVRVFFWIGLLLALCGALLFLAPIIVYVASQLRTMLNV